MDQLQPVDPRQINWIEETMSIKTAITWRTQYDAATDAQMRELTDIHPGGESLTVQSHKDDADINVIAKRMGLLGIMPDPIDPTFYADASNLPDLRAVLEYGRDAEAKFLAIPPDIRNRFHNDPAELWEFVLDENNREEAIRLGLIAKPAPAGAGDDPGTPPETPK